MRLLSHSLIVAALAGIVVPSALAADATCPTCPGPLTKSGSGTLTITGGARLDHAPITMVDATFLGLITEPISLERAGDLNLPAGTGLSVVRVGTGSPAAKAGFQVSDVLTKMDDQILVNPAQLRVLVRSHGAADALAFQIIRKGKTQTLKTGLGTMKLPELSPGGEEPRMFFPQGAPDNRFQLGGQLSPENIAKLREFRARAHALPAPAGKNDGQDEATEEGTITSEAQIDGGSGEAPRNLAFSSRVVSNDGTHTIEIEHGKREHLRITDKSGKEIHSGALPTNDKEWAKVPEEVRSKAKAMAHATRGNRVEKADETPGTSF